MLIYLLNILVIESMCGVITMKINKAKGYNGGFAWGFFLGIIGVIVVTFREDNVES